MSRKSQLTKRRRERVQYVKSLVGIMNVAEANAAMMVQDPEGDCPKCKNALGTWICERCGEDVRGKNTACKAVPKKFRWRSDFSQSNPIKPSEETKNQ